MAEKDKLVATGQVTELVGQSPQPPGKIVLLKTDRIRVAVPVGEIGQTRRTFEALCATPDIGRPGDVVASALSKKGYPVDRTTYLQPVPIEALAEKVEDVFETEQGFYAAKIYKQPASQSLLSPPVGLEPESVALARADQLVPFVGTRLEVEIIGVESPVAGQVSGSEPTQLTPVDPTDEFEAQQQAYINVFIKKAA